MRADLIGGQVEHLQRDRPRLVGGDKGAGLGDLLLALGVEPFERDVGVANDVVAFAMAVITARSYNDCDGPVRLNPSAQADGT